MKTFTFTIIIILTFVSSLCHALDPRTFIIKQTDGPITIVRYTAEFKRGEGQYVSEGIHHKVTYFNSTEVNIDAVKFGFVSFDAFDSFIGQLGGIDVTAISPKAEQKRPNNSEGKWVDHAYGDFAFCTGIAYVAAVRFENGEVWHADQTQIAAALEQVQENFDMSLLDAKK